MKGQLQEHLNLISKNVKLFGVPGHEVIDYAVWSEHRLITRIDYRNIRVLATNSTAIRFAAYELQSFRKVIGFSGQKNVPIAVF